MEREQDEAELSRGLRAGDRAAWLALYDRSAGPLWRHISRLLGHAHAAADVMQATMLAAAESAHRFDPARGTLWMWLWGIARKQALLHLRRTRRDQHSGIDASVVDWLSGSDPMPPDALESSETRDHVRL